MSTWTAMKWLGNGALCSDELFFLAVACKLGSLHSFSNVWTMLLWFPCPFLTFLPCFSLVLIFLIWTNLNELSGFLPPTAVAACGWLVLLFPAMPCSSRGSSSPRSSLLIYHFPVSSLSSLYQGCYGFILHQGMDCTSKDVSCLHRRIFLAGLPELGTVLSSVDWCNDPWSSYREQGCFSCWSESGGV